MGGRSKRLKLKIKPTVKEYVIIIISILMIFVMFFIAIVHWGSVGSQIPIHFDFIGRSGHYVSKSYILAYPFGAVLIFIIVRILAHFPHLLNYLYPITTENAERQYKNAQISLGIIGLVCIFLICFGELIAIGPNNAMVAVWRLFFIICMLLLFATLFYTLYKMTKLK